MCVNALSRAFFISTMQRSGANKADETCQCPQSCFLHFYIDENMACDIMNDVSMPSVVLSSFLLRLKERMEIFFGCQCPQSCFLHFYTTGYFGKFQKRTVSMPSVVLSSFLRYPSKNPVKSRLSSLIFAGN